MNKIKITHIENKDGFGQLIENVPFHGQPSEEKECKNNQCYIDSIHTTDNPRCSQHKEKDMEGWEERFEEFWNPSGSSANEIGERVKQFINKEIQQARREVVDLIEKKYGKSIREDIEGLIKNYLK